MMNLIDLTDMQEIANIKQRSFEKPQIIFKHSTTCGISSVALNRFKNSTTFAEADYYILDLRKHRDISQLVAKTFEVQHESPQVIVVKDGNAIYHESHFSISMDAIMNVLQ